MKNEKEFLEKVEEGALAKKDIATLYNPRLSNLCKMFRLYFGRNIFKFLNTVKFDVTKRERVLVNFGEMYCHFSAIGESEKFDGLLAERYGIQVVEVSKGSMISKLFGNAGDMKSKDSKKFGVLWDEEFHGEMVGSSGNVLEKMIDAGQSVQTDITKTTEDIIGNAAEVEDACEVTKGPFMKAVALKTKLIARGPVNAQEYYQKIHANRDSEDEAMEPVMKGVVE